MKSVAWAWRVGCGAVLVVAGAFAAEPVRMTGRTMGTTWAVSYTAGVGADAGTVEVERVRGRVQERLDALEQIFSTYREDSEVMRFNRAAGGEWVSVSAELAEVAGISAAISARTGGAFDATVAPLVELWGFGPRGVTRLATWPGEEEIAAARRRVGFRGLEMREEPAAWALRKVRTELAVDFSSVAKGYAADAVARVLSELGAPEHLVQVAGDMRSGGARRWRVGVEAPGPGGREGEMAAVVELGDGAALSTSGNYRNAIVRGGRRVGHIIDPRTGRPVESDVVAVSVVAASAAQSSGWATGLFVLGLEEGMRVAERERLAVMFLVRSGDGVTRRATAGFEGVSRRENLRTDP